MTARGIRNHNPGNIERTNTAWEGMAEDQSGDDRFIVFKDPVWGIRAIAVVLQTYRRKHDLETAREIAGRWAPPQENDTAAYAKFIRDRLDASRGSVIDINEPVTARDLVAAIIEYENGEQPYPDSVIYEGLAEAGYSVGAKMSDDKSADVGDAENSGVSWVPDRKVLAGGLGSIAAFGIVTGAEAMGVSIGMEAALGVVGSVATVAAYLTPPSVDEVVRRFNERMEDIFSEGELEDIASDKPDKEAT